jgi:hypothetical protein
MPATVTDLTKIKEISKSLYLDDLMADLDELIEMGKELGMPDCVSVATEAKNDIKKEIMRYALKSRVPA